MEDLFVWNTLDSVPVRSRYCPCSFTYRRTGEIQRVLQWSCPFYDSMFTIDCAWLAIVNRPGRRLFFLRRLCLVPCLCLQVLFAGTRIHGFKTEIAADRLLCHAGLHRACSPSIHYITDNLRVTHSSPIQPSRFFLSPQGSAKPVRHETS